jgi:hypothetical protein
VKKKKKNHTQKPQPHKNEKPTFLIIVATHDNRSEEIRKDQWRGEEVLDFVFAVDHFVFLLLYQNTDLIVVDVILI